MLCTKSCLTPIRWCMICINKMICLFVGLKTDQRCVHSTSNASTSCPWDLICCDELNICVNRVVTNRAHQQHYWAPCIFLRPRRLLVSGLPLLDWYDRVSFWEILNANANWKNSNGWSHVGCSDFYSCLQMDVSPRVLILLCVIQWAAAKKQMNCFLFVSAKRTRFS